MNQIEVCLTPKLIHQHQLAGKVVVVADIFRATSCMVTGMAFGIRAIHPVGSVEACLALGQQGMVMAGEREGQKVAGFDMGNSPYEYMQDHLRGCSVAVTTTNGTRAILASTAADRVLIGAFLNLEALAIHLKAAQRDVVIHCAGWRGMVNVEDTLFAGALIHRLDESHQVLDDPALLAHQLYVHNRQDLLAVAKSSAHAHRLAGFGAEKDLEFCMRENVYSCIPEFRSGRLQPSSGK